MERGRVADDRAEEDTALLETALEAERSRLADLLHDGPLSALIATLQDLEDDGPTAVDGAVSDLRRVVAELRSITRAHHGERHAGMPLGQAIEEVVRTAAGRARVDLRLRDADVLERHAALVRSAALELTANATRHGGAANVRVSTALVSSAAAELVVEDDGRGFDPALAARRVQGGHLGLDRLRRRAALAGGRVAIDTGPGGTRVVLRLPASREHPADRTALPPSRAAHARATDAWMIVRADATYAHVSDGLCDLLGYGRDELLRIPPDERPWFPDRARAAAGRERIVDRTVAVGRHSASLEIVPRTGRRVRVLATSELLPERDADGGPLFFALFREATTLVPDGPAARGTAGPVGGPPARPAAGPGPSARRPPARAASGS